MGTPAQLHKRGRRRLAVIALFGALAALSPLTSAAQAAPEGPVSGLLSAVPLGCALPVAVGSAHCYAHALGRDGVPFASSGPVGLDPTQIKSAYGLTTLAASNGSSQTVAIVDAYDDKTAEADLGVYRSTFGIAACTTANGCFKKVNQSGVQGSYPANNTGWATEISLDLDAVSAACPKCHILLVEATSPTTANLAAAVDTAARLGATVISNSYGGAESAADTATNAHYNHPGIPITVSSGDSGYGVEYPAASPYVTAVGGTTLTAASNARGYTESTWSGAGSGCSAYQAKPAWQVDTGCARRSVADVSADADPASGLAVYDSNCTGIGQLLGQCFKGWAQVGGTSLSSPLIAAVYALAGNGAAVTYGSYPYAHAGSLYDITTGNNGTCTPAYLCTAGAGYDGPTGVGTPNAIGGF